MKSRGEDSTMQTARVTLDEGGDIEAVGVGVDRGVSLFTPYGYTCRLPAGEEVFIAKNGGMQAGLGVRMKESVKSGEIKISSPFGSYIHLKSDGSVVINGLVIDKNGTVINGE